MPDYVPAPDADFNTWQTNFKTYVTTNAAVLGLAPADITPLTVAEEASDLLISPVHLGGAFSRNIVVGGAFPWLAGN